MHFFEQLYESLLRVAVIVHSRRNDKQKLARVNTSAANTPKYVLGLCDRLIEIIQRELNNVDAFRDIALLELLQNIDCLNAMLLDIDPIYRENHTHRNIHRLLRTFENRKTAMNMRDEERWYYQAFSGVMHAASKV